jgi:hypothetical protein
MNTKHVGEVSEAVIIAECLKLGYSISKPFGDNQRYDLILDVGGTLKKVQCKTGRIKDGAVHFPICSTKNYNGNSRTSYVGEVDFIFVYCPDNDAVYWLDLNTNKSKTSVSYRVKTPEYPQEKIRYAEDFVLDTLVQHVL